MEILQYFPEKLDDSFNNIKKKYKKNSKLKNIPENSHSIKCHNGIFIGKEEDNIISYKGIPFAKPPIKNLRWKPPLECENSNEIFESYYFQKSSIQTNDPGEISSYYEIGEDCLYLNIWKYNDNIKNKPVMVYIHGGGFGWGGTVDPLYNGFNYIKTHKDIILITISYRVSILGFLDLTQIKGGENYKESPNLGLLDQIQALKWINKNIENFSGDKNNVTIFGESAGGLFVTVLPLIKEAKGLFKRIISQSGTFAWCISREEGKSLINRLKKEIKKERKEELDINYLLNLSEEEIIKLNSKLNLYCLPPMRDGYIIPEDCYKAVENGAYEGIDLIIGSNADEARYWIIECGNYFFYKIGMKILVENIIIYRIKKNGKDIFDKYKKIVKENTNDNFMTDLFFGVPALRIAQIHSKNNGNVYLYYWKYPSSIPNFGACHAVELAYIFNNLKESHFIGDIKINYKLAEISQDMWANFAKNGNPSIKGYKWEKFDNENNYCMIFGKNVELKANIFNKKRNDLIIPLLSQYLSYEYASLSFNVPSIRKIIYFFLIFLIIIISLLINKYL